VLSAEILEPKYL